MNQTNPNIKLDYELVGSNYIESWDFVFTAKASDITSGMSHVEFFLNDLLQDTIYGPDLLLSGVLNIMVVLI